MSFKKILIISIIVLMLLVIIAGIVFGVFFMKDSNNEKAKEEYYFNVGEVYSNLADSKRIMKLNLTISVTDEKLMESFEEKSFLIKDELYKILRNKNITDVEGKEGQLVLTKEIISSLNKTFDTDKIKDVYFDEIIVQ